MIGIDEAGRGPVIGSMFVACVEADESILPDDIRDSKQLTNTRVSELATEIVDHPETRVIAREITARDIDIGDKNLTTVTAEVMSELINTCLEVRDGNDMFRVVVDAGHSDANTYYEMVVGNLDNNERVNLLSEHRADENHGVVSAAGIVAKSLREAHINELHKNGIRCGSGYPGDPTTIQFLESIIEQGDQLPPFVRESWQTIDDIRGRVEQTTLKDVTSSPP